ncbi:hypothetical protein FVE67_08410 [Thermosulfurimonas marina]|uniref:Basal-body rod modification protein FlgD n=1 Tax=Thermosulfurimonas marina TaxID=2047767 RepID=A0A6H1WUI1_9BACT|nr:FlgD immunoglobulin-like domain containing protein [Thermosulfurimonas marina]QJA06809.1 hypothetical protein FVE67_08410 [Thermosulfurimonas marina]
MIAGVNEKTGQPLALERVPKKTLSRDDFMLLFIKQLQFQDPMKPIENNEMAMQMALFSQVDQLFDLNQNFEKILELARDFSLSATTSLLGKTVKVKGDYGRVEGGKFLGAEFELEEPAQGVEVVITDEQGRLVKRLSLGSLPAGKHRVEWDATDENGNPVPDGNYRLRVILPGKNPQDTPSLLVTGRVTGAVLGDTPQVVVNGQLLLKPSEIERVFTESS